MTDLPTTANGKALKFRMLAEKRVSTAINVIRRIGNLSRNGSYEYSPEQVKKIFGVLRREIDEAESKFAPQEKKSKPSSVFQLD